MRFTLVLLLAASLCSGNIFAEDNHTQSSRTETTAAAGQNLSIEIRIYELEDIANKAIGFDWYTSQGLQMQGGTQPAIPGQAKPPGKVATLSGILSDPQFRAVTRALDARENAPHGRSDLIAASGKPLLLRRADGWSFGLHPVYDPKTDRITTPVRIEQSKGPCAGFHLETELSLANGDAAVFCDAFVVESENKKKEATRRRLVISIVIRPMIQNLPPED